MQKLKSFKMELVKLYQLSPNNPRGGYEVWKKVTGSQVQTGHGLLRFALTGLTFECIFFVWGEGGGGGGGREGGCWPKPRTVSLEQP